MKKNRAERNKREDDGKDHNKLTSFSRDQNGHHIVVMKNENTLKSGPKEKPDLNNPFVRYKLEKQPGGVAAAMKEFEKGGEEEEQTQKTSAIVSHTGQKKPNEKQVKLTL